MCSLCDVSIVALLLSGGFFALSQSNSKGRSFMLSFLPSSDGRAQHFMVITTYAETTVYIHVTFTGNHSHCRLAKDYSLQLKLPSEMSNLTNVRKENKSVFVYATQPISVYGISNHRTSRAAFMAIPVEKWGDRYLVATYGEFIILAAEDNTVVNVEFNFIGSAICKAEVEINKLLTFDLQRGEVLRIACNNDMTGSRITGNHAFGVISGNQCTKIPTSSAKYCDQITEMMIPISMLGQEYIVIPVASDQSKLRIVFSYNDSQAMKDLTPFEVNITSSGPRVNKLESNRLFQELSLESGAIVKVKANRPVMAILYTSLFGNAAMTVVPTVERFDSEYNLFVNKMEEDLSYEFGIHGSMMYTLKGFQVFAINASNSDNVQTKTVNRTFWSSDSLHSANNILVSVGGNLSSMGFPAGMKLDYYIGTDNCRNSPCQNNGSCYTIGSTVKCFCGNQLAGDFCEQDIYNACQSQPCQNGGDCKDEFFDFTCICSANFAGKMCAEKGTGITTSKPTKMTTTRASTTVAKSSSATTTRAPTTTKSLKKTMGRELCNCTCDNVTVELITKTKKEIEKELIVDPKTVSKTKTKYESTYDKRTSAAGIGIMGILFLSLVFGSIAFLDLLSAGHYILSKYLAWRDGPKLEQRPKSSPPATKSVRAGKAEKLKACIANNVSGPGGVIILPRFKVDKDGLVVLDVDRNNFSWSLKKQTANWEKDSIIDEVITGSVCGGKIDQFVHDSKEFDPVDLDKGDESLSDMLDNWLEQKSHMVDNPFDGADNSADRIHEMNVFHAEDDTSNVDVTLEYAKNIPFDCASMELNNLSHNTSPKDQIRMEKQIPPYTCTQTS